MKALPAFPSRFSLAPMICVAWGLGVMAALSPVTAQEPNKGPVRQLQSRLAEKGVELGLPSLLDQLAHHRDAEVRVLIADYLGILGDRAAVGALLRVARQDDFSWVRQAAAVALWKLKQPEGLEILRAEMAAGKDSVHGLQIAQRLAMQLDDGSGFVYVRDSVLGKRPGGDFALSILPVFLRFAAHRGEVLTLLLAQIEKAEPLVKTSLIWQISTAYGDGHADWVVLEKILAKASADTDPKVSDLAKRLLDNWRLTRLHEPTKNR